MDKQNRKELLASYKERKVVGGVFAIKNTINGRMHLITAADLQGYKNRYGFAQSMGQCVDKRIEKEFDQFGYQAFDLEVLEELEKTEKQTDKEFKEDLEALKEIWLEKLGPDKLF